MSSTRDSLEDAMMADPENITLHSAYADLLIEDGDPRGEFIRLELAMADDNLPDHERDELEQQWSKIETQFAREWLGTLTPTVPEFVPYRPGIPRVAKPVAAAEPLQVFWRRGWIVAAIVADAHRQMIQSLASHPYAKLLADLTLIGSPIIHEACESEWRWMFQSLARMPIRSLSLCGFREFGDQFVELLETQFGDSRLRALRLDDCGLTDDGARSLVSSRMIHRLDSLEVPRNFLSPIGMAMLAEHGFDAGPQNLNPAWEVSGD